MTSLDLRRFSLLVGILVALLWYFNARAHQPAAASVNGVYTNACCGSLMLRDGVIVVGTARVPFDLESMKFGLTAYPSQRVFVQGGQVKALPDPDPAPLSFEQNGMLLIVCEDRLCNRRYAFKRR